jgi:serine/threonine-protein kinase
VQPTPIVTPAPTKPPPAVQPTAYDPYPSAKAAGASAVCADGTWSYSKNRSGTCSKHGGVHWWTGNLGPAGPGAH